MMDKLAQSAHLTIDIGMGPHSGIFQTAFNQKGRAIFILEIYSVYFSEEICRFLHELFPTTIAAGPS